MNGTDAAVGDISVNSLVFGCVGGNVVYHCTQVLEIQQQQAFVVGDAEDDVHHAALHLIESEKPAQEHRAHVRNRGTHGMSLLAEHVINSYRATGELGILNTEFRHSLLDESAHGSRLADAAQVSLHVGHEAGNTCLTESFCKHLERYCLSCTGSSGDKSMAVGHFAANRYRAFLAMGDIEPTGGIKHNLNYFSQYTKFYLFPCFLCPRLFFLEMTYPAASATIAITMMI